MSDEGTAAKKIIVDEDWKTQVQAEKEALTRGQPPKSETAAAEASPASKQYAPLPPASLTTLITMLASQATISLGAVAHPVTGKVEADLDEARHMIDLLQVLEQKTHGNRTPQEINLLSRVLNELRMAFVSVQQQLAAAGTAAEK